MLVKLQKKLVYMFFTWLMLLMAQTALGATIDIGSVAADSGLLRVRTVVRGGSQKVKAVGFGLIYPSDALEFSRLEAPDGVMVEVSSEPPCVTVGVISSVPQDVIIMEFLFKITSKGPYLFAIDPEMLNGVKIGQKRPFVSGEVNTLYFDSVSSHIANILLAVPGVARLKGAQMRLNGDDVLQVILNNSQWYYDEIKDVFYMVYSGRNIPEGRYNLELVLDYGRDGVVKKDVTIDISGEKR